MLLYRALLILAFPLLFARLLLLRLQGRETAAGLAERLGAAPPRPAEAKTVIWIHGASNGELASAEALIRALLDATPGLHALVTANTATARAMVAGWDDTRIAAAQAPLDLRPVLRRFLRRSGVSALLVIENEFWPNRLALCADRGLPVMVVGARMSARSARGWARLPGLARQMLGAIRALSPQDLASARRFRELGLAPERIGPVLNLKAAVLPAPPEAERARLAPRLPRARTLLAASTHAGEEAVVLEAFAALHAADPAWRLILAPRHPRRAEEVAGLVRAAGLAEARRSQGALPDSTRPVWLADTMGEMALWYALARLTFVGGSLVEKGGHTPFEPAALGSAILSGPHVANAAEAYGALFDGRGAQQVRDAASLVEAVQRLEPPGAAEAQAHRAQALLAPHSGAAHRAEIVARLSQLLSDG